MNQDALSNFICSNYCQFCDNAEHGECNIYTIQEKYQTNELTAEQMTEVGKFELNKAACKNHLPNGWFSTQEISALWHNDRDIDYIDIIFTDV